MNRTLQLRCAGICCVMAVLACLSPSAARADAPGVRGPESAPVGAVGSAGWTDIEPLPPLGVSAPSTEQSSLEPSWASAGLPGATIYGQAADQTVGTAAFSLRALNPGNWVLDAGLGIVSATMQSIQQTLLGFVSAVAGTPPPTADTGMSLGCNSSGLSLLFCTKPEHVLPAGDLIGKPKDKAPPANGPSQAEEPTQNTLPPVPNVVNTVWLALQPAAFALLTIVFTVRLGRVMYAGPAAFRSEVKALLMPFLAACAFVAAAPALLRMLLGFFVALNSGILDGNIFGYGKIEIPFLTYLPMDFLTTMSLGPATALLALFVVLFITFVVALIRLAKLTLLIALAPLAGATLIDRSTAQLFGNWISKVLELLMHQLGWSIAALVGSTILNTLVPSQAGKPTDANSFMLHTIGTTLILLFMLCQQQLFSGVFSLVAGAPPPVMGGALEKVATVIAVRDGVTRKANNPTAARNGATNTGTGSSTPPAARPAPRTQQAIGYGGWKGGRSGASTGPSVSNPGARARAATQRAAGTPSRPASAPVRPVAPTPAQPMAPVPAMAATPPSSGYIAAGRARRNRAPSAPAAAAATVLAISNREATIRRLQAQALQTGRQAWRAAPAALAVDARWGAQSVSSAAGQRALRSLQQRPVPVRRAAIGAPQPPSGTSS